MSKTSDKELENSIIAKLSEIYDPEIPVDIYALGLIYDIKISKKDVIIIMTLTSPNCPVAESLPEEIRSKVQKITKYHVVEVKIVFEPTWTKDMMSEEAKLELGML
tara:strand:- start:4471 stop:4788 length:318 start_codon:yes stop_codon:yes gene_type:complete